MERPEFIDWVAKVPKTPSVRVGGDQSHFPGDLARYALALEAALVAVTEALNEHRHIERRSEVAKSMGPLVCSDFNSTDRAALALAAPIVAAIPKDSTKGSLHE